jgi:ATP-binding cassette subfamily B protein
VQRGGWLFVRSAIDDGMRAGDERRLVLTVVGYVTVNLIGWGLAVVLTRGLARLGQAIVLDVRQRLFDHLTGLSLRYFGRQRAGWIIARLTSDVDALMDVSDRGW